MVVGFEEEEAERVVAPWNCGSVNWVGLPFAGFLLLLLSSLLLVVAAAKGVVGVLDPLVMP